MDNKNKKHWGNGIVNGVLNFLSKGWETINMPSKTRCDVYSEQASSAQKKIEKDGISRRERKYWSKQHDKAMSGLADVHKTNGETFVKAICAIGAGLLIGNKLLNLKK